MSRIDGREATTRVPNMTGTRFMEVQIISDVVCPWCRIGKVNLRAAAAQWTEETGEEVHVTFLPCLRVGPGSYELTSRGGCGREIMKRGTLARVVVEPPEAPSLEEGSS